MNIMFIIILAISLSMDAFSLSLAYGTLKLKKDKILLLSLIVGLYHFFMPLIGLKIGTIILSLLKIKPDIIVFVVLFIIGLQMIIESFKNEENIRNINIMEMILFGFAVSIDSFSIGISMNFFTISPLICVLIFFIFSFLFTFIGLNVGKKVSKILGKTSTIIGGISLIILGLIYL